jgi:hypothetical protein
MHSLGLSQKLQQHIIFQILGDLILLSTALAPVPMPACWASSNDSFVALQVNEAIRLYKVWMKAKVQCDLANAFPSSLAEVLCAVAYQRLGNTQAGMQRRHHTLDVLVKALQITAAVVEANGRRG